MSTVFIFTLAGCVTLYKPNAIHSPLLSEQGQMNVSTSLGLSGTGLVNLEGAYAVTDHVGVMADGMYHYRNTNTSGVPDSGIEKLRIISGEVGAGYFARTGDRKIGLFQVYAGAGYGESSDKITTTYEPPPEASAKYINVFVQPGFAMTYDNVELAFDIRANYVQLFDINAYLYEEFEWWNTDFQYYSDTTIDFMNLEPALTIKAGGNNLKALLQLGLTIPTVDPDSYFAVNSSALLIGPLFKFSIGISYTIGKSE